jgi:prolyl oligopeptidase
VPEAKSSVDWLDRDLLLLSSALGGGMATNSGYARTVRLWRRGQSPFDAPVIHEVPATYMAVSAALDRESEGERVVFVERSTFIDTVYRLGDRNGAGDALDLPTDAWIAWQRGWSQFARTTWRLAAKFHAPDTVNRPSVDGFSGRRSPLHGAVHLVVAAPFGGFSGPMGSWCCRSSTT